MSSTTIPFDVGMTGLIGFRLGLRRDEGLRHAAAARHRLPLPAVLSRGRQDRADRHPAGEPRATLPARPRPGRRCRRHGRGAAAASSKPKTDRTLPRRLPWRITRRRARTSTSWPRAAPAANIIHPQYVARLVSELAADDAIFTCDVGTPDGLGGALSQDERQAAADRLVQPRLDGQRHAAGDRRAGRRTRAGR